MSYVQRETPILADLCTSLVEDHVGELAARIFSVLARLGRQTLAAIARASYLSARQIRNGLSVLLQHNLVFHSPVGAPLVHYEIDWHYSYALVRQGSIAKFVEERFDKRASNVVANLLSLGPTRIGDLKEAYFPAHDADSDDESDDGTANGSPLKKAKTNGVNGISTKTNGDVNGDSHTDHHATNGATELGAQRKHPADDIPAEHVNGEPVAQDEGVIASEKQLLDIVQLLMREGWLMEADQTQFLSPGDLHAMVQETVIEEEHHGIAPTGTKAKDDMVRSILRRKRKIRDGWLTVPATLSSRKRQAPDSGHDRSTKRLKTNGGNEWSANTSNGASSQRETSPEDDIPIRVNPEKVAVAMRSAQLVHLVEQRLGLVTAQVYQTILWQLERDLPRCFEEWPDPPLPLKPGEEPNVEPPWVDPESLITARDIAKNLDRHLDVCAGLDPHTIVKITGKGHVRGNVLTEPVDPYGLSLDEKTRVVDAHIHLLSEDPFHFVSWHSRAGTISRWRVEFDEISKALIQYEIENTVLARQKGLGVKLIRALKKKGRLDERGACNAMMMSANDIRGTINDLTVQGMIQTQEVPKVDRREAKHSLHLIWYDRQRAREKLLHDTYKGMLRIIQRIAFEREKVQVLISKAERSDVVGNEEKWLSQSDLDELKKWREVQEKLFLQLTREDELVATLRDFIGPLVSA
ncbi:RNA polymerase III subunit RPC82-domain-containing protein [Massariosphaeria phaeospora]|uniref:DNA-directed RNA polymerase III subunit RPC3 n=1 Tax=Massariosphaeria phaeospora TaxID=100035 RepID=A0A7C8HZ13_9PLEO|nr:RNA polymerase III subunit RPC82-domain-containing protein [Massariosphaeria phaeospora]